MSFPEVVELLPGKRLTLTAMVEVPEQVPCCLVDKLVHRLTVERHRIVLDVSSELGAEYRPNLLQREYITHPSRPFVHPLELAAYPLSARSELGDHGPAA